MKHRYLKTSLLTATIGFGLVGCDSDDNNETTIRVVDGYIINATVTDANGNTAFKSDERDGHYFFTHRQKYPLTSEFGTFKDTGNTFTGKMYAAEGDVISPITTLVTKLDANGSPTAEVDTTRTAKIATITGVNAGDLTADYMAAGNTDIAKIAQLAHVMNQDANLMAKFKTDVDASSSTAGNFTALKTIADSAIDYQVSANQLGDVHKIVYKNILNAVANFTDANPSNIENAINDDKIMLSNIDDVVTMGGDIGTDASAFAIISTLLDIAGKPDSTITLTTEQLSDLGVNDIVTSNATLTTFLHDVLKNRPGVRLLSKAQVKLVADNLSNLYLLDINDSASINPREDIQSAVELLTNKTVLEYQTSELDNIFDSNTYEIGTYADLNDRVDNLAIIAKPTLSVTLVDNLVEAFSATGTVVGSKVATVSAEFPSGSELKEYSLALTGDGSKFSISSSTGVITTKEDFDYESQKSYVITVEVTSQTTGSETLTIATSSEIVTINVVNVSDFGIQKLVYNHGENTASSDDILVITFNDRINPDTLSVDKFTIGNVGTFSGSATGSYSDSRKSYTITNFDTAMSLGEINDTATGIVNISSITMSDDVKDLNGTSAAVKNATLDTISFNGKEYGVVASPNTPTIWLDRNIGAAQVASTFNDALSYGNWYQWGSINPHTSTPTLSDNDDGSDALGAIDEVSSVFIRSGTPPYDWVSVDADGANRSTALSAIDGSTVCPTGFRVPTEDEWKADVLTGQTRIDVFNGFLKLPVNAFLRGASGAFSADGIGYYWTADVASDTSLSRNIKIDNTNNSYASNRRVSGMGIRCIKD